MSLFLKKIGLYIYVVHQSVRLEDIIIPTFYALSDIIFYLLWVKVLHLFNDFPDNHCLLMVARGVPGTRRWLRVQTTGAA